MSGAPVPPAGWPTDVPPPGAPDWERRAVAWLYDLCPPDYRGYDVLRRQPVALAHLAAATVASAAEAAERALRTGRHELRDVMTPEGIEAALLAFERERHRLTAAARAVDLIGRALRGERWTARL